MNPIALPTFPSTLELPIEVEYEILPASPGSCDSFGAPIEPEVPVDLDPLDVLCPVITVRWTGRRDFDSLVRLLSTPCPTEHRDLLLREITQLVHHLQSAQMLPLVPYRRLTPAQRHRLRAEAKAHATSDPTLSPQKPQ